MKSIPKIFSGLLLAGALWTSCHSSKATPKDYEGAMITFGEGGGFAGIENAFTLLDNGRLFENAKSQQDYVQIGKLKSKAYKQVFETLTSLKLNEYRNNTPGNIYQFIEINMNGQKNRIVWDGSNPLVKKEVLTLYQILNNLRNE